MLPLLSPATTWALVATSPGPTTKPEPSCSLLHAVPRILTVEKTAGSASAWVSASWASTTDGVEGGVSVEKTWGKPWSFRKVWRSLKTEGAWGRTLSMEWRMSERATAASSDVNRLLGDSDHCRHDPDGEQDGQDGHPDPQDGVHIAQVMPADRDVAPGPEDATARSRHAQAVSRTSDTTTMERVTSSCPRVNSGTQTRVPSRKPRKNPPNVRIWTRAPSRRPWTAASNISPMISRSTQSTAARVANGAPGNAPPTAIVVVPCFRPPCLDTGVSGDAVAVCPSLLLPWPSPRRAVPSPDTPVYRRPRASSVSPTARLSPLGSRRPRAPVNSVRCRARRPGAVGPWVSPGPIRPRRPASR